MSKEDMNIENETNEVTNPSQEQGGEEQKKEKKEKKPKLSKEEKKELKQEKKDIRKEERHAAGFNARKVRRKTTFSIMSCIIVIAVVIGLNILVGLIPDKYTQFDISVGKLYTITDETKKVLKDLNQDVTLYYIVQNDNKDTTIERLLKKYAENKHVKLEYIDPVKQPSFTSDYTEDTISENSVIVVSGKRNKIVTYDEMYEKQIDYSSYSQYVSGFDGEGQLTSAIQYLQNDNIPAIYYVSGHGEIAIPTDLVNRIEKANFELKELNLLTADNIPEDAACVIMNSPEKDITKEEAALLSDYLANSGKLLMCTDFVEEKLSNYYSVLSGYGVEVADGLLIETDMSKYVQSPYIIVPSVGYSEFSSDMMEGVNILMSGCQGMKVSENVDDSIEIEQILTPSEDAFVKTDVANMKDFNKEDQDEDGPFFVGAAIKKTNEDDKSTQIVVYSSSSITNTTMNQQVGGTNYDLYMKSLGWMCQSDNTSAVSIASKAVSPQTLTVTAAKAIVFELTLGILLPILCLVSGIVIVVRRRHR